MTTRHIKCLSSIFNNIRANTSVKKSQNSTGLFGSDELSSADGFTKIRQSAFNNADTLVNRIYNLPAGSEKVLPLFDELSNTLCKVADLAEFIRIGHSNAKFRSCAEQTSVAISSLVEQLNTNQRLYNILKKSSAVNELDRRVLDLFLFDFEQNGIHLDEEKRNLVLSLNENILRSGSIFVSNVRQEVSVSKSQIPRKLQEHFNFDFKNNTSINSRFYDNDNEDIRELGYRFFHSYDKDIDSILYELLSSRLKLAQLCGFKNYAERVVDGSLAGTPKFVQDFLNVLNDRLRYYSDNDLKILQDMKNNYQLSFNSSNNPKLASKLQAWDISYYSSKYKSSRFNDELQQCLPYFSIGSCMDGLNIIFKELYGVEMVSESCAVGELWHNDVIKLSIVDCESKDVLGFIYCDLFERNSKQRQDVHHTIRCGCQLPDGTFQLPIVVLVLSLPYPTDSSPSLLSPMMVDNLFHEMGHAMHTMLARTKYQHISGTRCSTDLAEIPSILMEFFSSDIRVITTFARHHATGKQIPESLAHHWLNSKKVLSAADLQLQVFLAALDQAYHGEVLKCSATTTTEVLQQVQSQYYQIPYVENTAWQLKFSHLVGYGAKYYSYLLARAVASGIWHKLFANEPLSRKAGLEFKNQVLVHGGGKPASEIIETILSTPVTPEFAANTLVESLGERNK